MANRKVSRKARYLLKVDGWTALFHIMTRNADYRILENGIFVDVTRRRAA
jgi:hypothetical protein